MTERERERQDEGPACTQSRHPDKHNKASQKKKKKGTQFVLNKTTYL